MCCYSDHNKLLSKSFTCDFYGKSLPNITSTFKPLAEYHVYFCVCSQGMRFSMALIGMLCFIALSDELITELQGRDRLLAHKDFLMEKIQNLSK